MASESLNNKKFRCNTMNPASGAPQGSINSTAQAMNINALDVSQTLQQSQSQSVNKNKIVSASDNGHVNISRDEKYLLSLEELNKCHQENQRLRDGYEQNIKLIQQRDKANNAFLQREKCFKKTIKDMQAALKQQQNQLNQYKIKMLRCKSLIDYTSIIENKYHESNERNKENIGQIGNNGTISCLSNNNTNCSTGSIVEYLMQWKQQFENTNNCSFYDEFEAYKQNIQNQYHQQYILQLAQIMQTTQMAQTNLIINNNNNTKTSNNNGNTNQNSASFNNNIVVDNYNHSDSSNQMPALLASKGKNKHHKKHHKKRGHKSKSQNLKTQDNNVLKQRNHFNLERL